MNRKFYFYLSFFRSRFLFRAITPINRRRQIKPPLTLRSRKASRRSPTTKSPLSKWKTRAHSARSKIELYSNVAPKMVARFKELAKEGVYNGTTFHRINADVIQGGDPFRKTPIRAMTARENPTNRMFRRNFPTFHTTRESSARRAGRITIRQIRSFSSCSNAKPDLTSVIRFSAKSSKE
jgi:cyclophilin family peptidyl-prolyl cis-trans isomerase